ncbi:unnamed protein product [Diplocarpon coronariae]|uniref:Uncharacterized protein n=1 Tax=Diplocarpon coronariae TaxID=2795749 RepID=A0A218Z9D5_9HELO|nr:hypothetical protein B2J93_9372 [Marssonina coronariae]
MATPQQPQQPKQKQLPVAEAPAQDEEYGYDSYDDDDAAPQQVQLRQPAPSANTNTPQYPAVDPRDLLPPRAEGYRRAAIRESRIKDRPAKPIGDSSLSIKIELDLEVEVDLYARVKGDVTIGLM